MNKLSKSTALGFSFFFIVFLCFVPHRTKNRQDAALINFMVQGYTSEQRSKFMEFAQKAADKENAESINLRHYERAFAQITFGHIGKFNNFLYVMNNKCKGIGTVAHHEAGHTLMTVRKDCGQELRWSSIEFCQSMLGYVYTVDYQKKHNQQIINSIMMLLAGGASEQIFKGKNFKTVEEGFAHCIKISSVASDLKKARVLAHQLVQNDQNIEQQVDELLKKYYGQTFEFLQQHYHEVEIIAQALLERKFLSCYDTYALLA